MPNEAKPLIRERTGAETAPRGTPLRVRMMLAIFAILVLFAGWETLTSIVAYTSDAYVQSDLIAIAPQITGQVVAVPIEDNQQVRKGDLLVSVDPVPFQLAVGARKADLAEANARVQADRDAVAAAQDASDAAVAARDLAVAEQGRVASLETDSFASRQALDTANEALRKARADADAAAAAVARAQRLLAMHEAAVTQATVELATAEWRLSRTQIHAPADGAINNLTVRVGDMARADDPLIGIVDAGAFRIIANYKQSYIRAFQIGGTAWVWLDSSPWRFHRARIAGIARGISRTQTPGGLLPYVAPRTDWIRLQRRFPVTLTLVDRPPDNRLFMGADARVVIFP